MKKRMVVLLTAVMLMGNGCWYTDLSIIEHLAFHAGLDLFAHVATMEPQEPQENAQAPEAEEDPAEYGGP